MLPSLSRLRPLSSSAVSPKFSSGGFCRRGLSKTNLLVYPGLDAQDEDGRDEAVVLSVLLTSRDLALRCPTRAC